MDDRTLERLLGDDKRAKLDAVRLRYAEVIDDSPLLIEIAASGVTVSASRDASYTPTIGDRVAVLIRGRDLLVICEVV